MRTIRILMGLFLAVGCPIMALVYVVQDNWPAATFFLLMDLSNDLSMSRLKQNG